LVPESKVLLKAEMKSAIKTKVSQQVLYNEWSMTITDVLKSGVNI
jgi:hypothetical protein